MHRPSFLRTALAALPFLAFLGGDAPPADAPERAPTEPEIPHPRRAHGGTSTKCAPSDATEPGRRAIAKRERQAALRRRQCTPRAEVSA
mgnify:CR=1 FL=1